MQNNLQILHANNHVRVAKKTYTGTSLTIQNTVNAPVEKLTIDGASSQVVTVQGKNICPTDISEWESGHYSATDGSEVIDTTRIRLKDLLRVTPSAIYYIHTNNASPYGFAFRVYDINKSFVRTIGAVGNGSTITMAGNEYYIGVLIYDSGNTATFATYTTAFGNGTIRPFICLNSQSDKAYAPFVPDSPSPNYPATITNVVNPVLTITDNITTHITNLLGTLRNLPNGVKDKLVIDKTTQTAWIERNVGSVVLNGSESWTLPTAFSTGNAIALWTPYPANCKIPFAPSYAPVDINSHFKQLIPMNIPNQISQIIAGTSQGAGGIYDNTGLYLVIPISITTSVATLKTWLASNNVTVQYQLATPTTESITYPSISTIQYLTNISKSGIASSISVDVLVMGN